MKTRTAFQKNFFSCAMLLYILILAGVSPSLIFAQRPGHPRGQSHPVGCLKISSEIQSTLLYDADTACRTMTPWHVVEINSTKPGSHTLTFFNKAMRISKQINVEPGATCIYKLKKDSTLTESVVPGKLSSNSRQKIAACYIPFQESFALQLKPGLGMKTGGSGANVKLIVAYYVAPNLSVGLGTGFLSSETHMTWKYANLFSFLFPSAWEKTSTEYFALTSVPLFANITISLTRKRVAPFISLDGGLSFPVNSGTIAGKVTGEGDAKTDPDIPQPYFRIDKIKMGGYFGFEFGVKGYLSPVFDLGFAMGVDMSFNKVYGTYYNDAAMKEYSDTFNKTVMPLAFTMHLVLGINLSRQANHKPM